MWHLRLSQFTIAFIALTCFVHAQRLVLLDAPVMPPPPDSPYGDSAQPYTPEPYIAPLTNAADTAEEPLMRPTETQATDNYFPSAASPSMLRTGAPSSLEQGQSAQATALLQQGKQKATEALAIYTQQQIGKPLWQEAVRLGEQAKQLSPGSSRVLYFLAESYSLTEYWALAWQNWKEYFAAGGQATAATSRYVGEVGEALGYLYYEEGFIEEAFAIYQAMTRYAPDNVKGYTWAARVLYEQGDYMASLPFWERAVALDPSNEGASYYLNEARARAPRAAALQRAAEAEAVTLASSSTVPIIGNTLEQGISLHQSGSYASAEEYLRQALQIDPENPTAWAYLARAAVAQRKWALAQQAIGRATLLDESNEEYRALRQQIRSLITNNVTN